MFHVLEHFNEPSSALEKTKSLLSNKGKIIVEVPNFAYEADSFLDSKGNPPNVGQLMIMISPDAINSKEGFLIRMEEMIKSILSQENVYLPGSRRFKLRENASKTGVLVSAKVMEDIKII